MKLKNIKIKNFKSLKSIDVSFSENKNIIIGKNSSGKTNFLEVISLILTNDFLDSIEERKNKHPHHSNCFNKKELFNDESEKIEIDLGIQLNEIELTYDKLSHLKDGLKQNLFERDGDNINILPIKFSQYLGEKSEIYFDQNSKYNEYYKLSKSFLFNSVFIGTDRRYAFSYFDELIQEEKRYINPLIENVFIKILIFFLKCSKCFKDLTDNLKNFFQNEIKNNLGEVKNIKIEIINNEDSIKSIEYLINQYQLYNSNPIIDVKNFFERYIEIYTESNNKKISLRNEGEGVQSLFLLNLLTSFNNVYNFFPLICIDEIEMNLHPITKKKLLYNLQKNEENQFFLTTHSKFFLETINPKELIFFKLDNNETKVFQIKENEKELINIFNRQIVRNENGDLFFSDFVILVEGKHDKIIFEELLKEEIMEFSIFIFDMNGKDDVKNCLKLLEKYEIPFFILLDNGIKKETKDFLDKKYKNQYHILSKYDILDYLKEDFKNFNEDYKKAILGKKDISMKEFITQKEGKNFHYLRDSFEKFITDIKEFNEVKDKIKLIVLKKN